MRTIQLLGVNIQLGAPNACASETAQQSAEIAERHIPRDAYGRKIDIRVTYCRDGSYYTEIPPSHKVCKLAKGN